MIISTVVPRALHNLQLLAVKYFGVDALIAGREPVTWGIALKVDEPRSVGADRAVNAIAAQAVEPSKDKLVISFGTATTLIISGPTAPIWAGSLRPGVNCRSKRWSQPPPNSRVLRSKLQQLTALSAAPPKARC